MKNASIGRPRDGAKLTCNPHGCSLLTGLLIAIFCLLAQGCAGAPPTTQTIYVPVSTPCLKDLPLRPAYEFDRLAPDATDGDKILALARDWPRGRKYEGALEAAVASCI